MRKKVILCLLLFLCGCAVSNEDPSAYNRARDLVNKGTAFLLQNKLAEARSAFDLSYKVYPNAPALDGIGCALIREGKYEDSLSYFEDAFKLDLNYVEAVWHYGFALEMLGDKDKALEYYKAAVERAPTDFMAQNNLGALLIEIAKSNSQQDKRMLARKALSHFQKAYVISPNFITEKNLVKIKKEKKDGY